MQDSTKTLPTKILPIKALIVGFVWPETNASAAGLREWALMEHFRAAGWQVSYASPAKENEFSARLRDLGVKTFSCQPNDPRFDDFVRELQPDYVVFDRFMIEEQFGWRVEEHAPDAVRILDTVDLHFLRRAREAALQAGAAPKSVDLDFISQHAREDFLRELSSLFRSDHAWVVSSFEEKLLQDFGVLPEQVSLLRLSYKTPDVSKLPRFEERQHFVSIGNFRHPPNADAVHWMKSDIWPRIRALTGPHAELHIYGAYPSKEFMSLDNPETGFRVLGPAKDQYQTLSKYRVLLAPLRFGAGIKGKISDAWFTGTGVVSTSIGAEGMTDGNSTDEIYFPGLVADDVEGFAQASYDLWKDEEQWKLFQTQGFELLSEAYSETKNQTRIIFEMIELRKNLKARRQKNWMGSVLQLNMHRSTKYFSRWIELKNSKT
jgi:glycosyltransferase involved in cell wall biosynthesis